LKFFFPVFFWLTLWFLPLAGFCVIVYYVITLPLRRQERARFFLDLLEVGFKQGRSPERTVTDVSLTRDVTVGVPFLLLAEHIQNGLGMVDALQRVPSLVSPRVAAVLRVGAQLGDIQKVLPACRGMNRDADSQTRNAFNYLLLIPLPTLILLPIILLGAKTYILSQLITMAEAYGAADYSTLMLKLVPVGRGFGIAELVVAVCIAIGIIAYIGGARLQRWLEGGLPPLSHWFSYAMPWRRKRMQRDFIAMLALLLDAGVPEEKSIRLAAASTANQVFVKRSEAAAQDLENGKDLVTALRRFDSQKELSWRLANAAHGQGGFFPALTGWMESLDVKAFQQEQTVSQLVTTGIIILNGVLVGVLAASLFYLLISIITELEPW
jgi:type II secretory pathway component PulF